MRVTIDENDIPRFRPEARATALIRGPSKGELQLAFVRTEPLVIPKQTLSGEHAERVDTRVLQILFASPPNAAGLFVGQHVDVFIKE